MSIRVSAQEANAFEWELHILRGKQGHRSREVKLEAIRNQTSEHLLPGDLQPVRSLVVLMDFAPD